MSIEFKPQNAPKSSSGNLKFTHDKSDQVQGTLQTREEFKESIDRPSLLWLPIILFVLSALDYAAMFNDDHFADTYFGGDSSMPFLFGILFAGLYFGVAAGVFFRLRWSVWLLIVTLIAELAFYYFIVAGSNGALFAEMRVPMLGIGGQTSNIAGIAFPIPTGFLLYVRAAVFGLIGIACLPVLEYGRKD